MKPKPLRQLVPDPKNANKGNQRGRAMLEKSVRTLGMGRSVLGVSALPLEVQSRIREKVETFKDFNEGNDPHQEHDFGVVEHAGVRVFWKIDYYDKLMQHGSDDPSDPKQTARVLTLMLAEEY